MDFEDFKNAVLDCHPYLKGERRESVLKKIYEGLEVNNMPPEKVDMLVKLYNLGHVDGCNEISYITSF